MHMFQKIQAAAYANAAYQPIIFPQMAQMSNQMGQPVPQMTGMPAGMQFVQLM